MGAKIILQQNIIDEICDFWEKNGFCQGYTFSTLTKKYNISHYMLLQILCSNFGKNFKKDAPKRKKPITNVEQNIIDEVCRLYHTGASSVDIATKLNVDRRVVFKILKSCLSDDEYKTCAKLAIKACGAKAGKKTKGIKTGPNPDPIRAAKISKANKGRPVSKEHREKLSNALKGHEISDEQRQQISATVKKLWETGHYNNRKKPRRTKKIKLPKVDRRRKIIDQSIIVEMCNLFRDCVSIKELREMFKLSRNKITAILRKELGDEYKECAERVIRSCSRKGWNKHPVRECNISPEKLRIRNKKISEANKGHLLSDEQKEKISIGVKKTYATFDDEKKKNMAIHVVETKRKNGYFEIHAKRHSAWMKENCPNRGKKASAETRRLQSEAKQRFFANGGKPSQLGRKRTPEECEKMSLTTKKMWADGKFSYGNGNVFRSKLEISVYEEFLKRFTDAQHSFPIATFERTYSFDVYVPSLNLLVEVNGDYWHFNPVMYEAKHFDKYRNVHAQDVWDADLKKHGAVQEMGYKTAIMWEFDINEIGFEQSVNDLINEHL